MRTLFAQFFCLIAALTIMEAPTMLWQTYAWATMLNDRIPEKGVSEAFASTFDGTQPCEHCLTVETIQNNKLAKQENQDTIPTWQLGSLKCPPLSQKNILAPKPPLTTRLPFDRTKLLSSLSFVPSVPTPPPRTV